MKSGLSRVPSLNGLRAFEVAARHLNFRIAAEELGVTQGAVAQQVRGLEAELGLQLFYRQARALALTEAGRAYVANIRKAFDLIADATAVLRPEPTHFTISVTPTFAAKWLLPRLPDFTDVFPEIDLRIVATDRVSNFQTDAIDLAVRFGQPPFGTALHAELLLEQTIIAVGCPAIVDQLPMESDLAATTLLHDSHNLWPQFLALALYEGSETPTKNLRFSQISLAIKAAIAGQGLALAPWSFVTSDLDTGRLKRWGSVELRTGSNFYLVASRRAKNADTVALVWAWFKRQQEQSG
jgi:LysR family transcriptional regulator, glycine cleavage system transcriptional activator